MIRPPPSSPLFPYPTLFRSRDVPADGGMRVELAEPLHAFFRVGQGGVRAAGRLDVGEQGEPVQVTGHRTPRSEEHTSELQSRQYLVCRLLLEKKNSFDVRFH